MKKIIKIVIAICTIISIVVIGLLIFFLGFFQPTFVSIIEPNIQRPEISVSPRRPPSVPTTPSVVPENLFPVKPPLLSNNPENNVSETNTFKIPEIFVDNLPKQQTKFLQTVDGFWIIETEIDTFFQDKTKERVIIFCFDINKKLIYCDQENLNNHFKDITVEGTSTKISVSWSTSSINLLKSNNSNVFYWISVHNHPSANSIHLPSEGDLDKTFLDKTISNWYLQTEKHKKNTKIQIQTLETWIQNTKELLIKYRDNPKEREYYLRLQAKLIEYQENLRFRQEQLEELNNSMTLLDKEWFSLVWARRVVSDYSRGSYYTGYKPSDGYGVLRDIFKYFEITKNYTIYNLQNI